MQQITSSADVALLCFTSTRISFLHDNGMSKVRFVFELIQNSRNVRKPYAIAEMVLRSHSKGY